MQNRYSLSLLMVCAGLAASPVSAQATLSGSPRSAALAAMTAAQSLPPGGINELKKVRINGIDQWISIRGANAANPMLLFIHGGPGATMMPESWTFQRPWEDFFTVVQWDQRGAGKTFSAANRQVDPKLSVPQLVSDTEAMIQYLRANYHHDKVFLMAHSFGSGLGVTVAQAHPEWLYAYIGVGQAVNGVANETVGYQETLAEARRVDNRAAISELLAIAPYPAPDGTVQLEKTIIERKWDRALGGMIYAQNDDDESLRRSLSPEYSDYDLRSAELGEDASLATLWETAIRGDFNHLPPFKCPVFIFAGAHDRTTPTSLTVPWFAHITAPKKQLFLIKNASHYVLNEAPGEVLVDLVQYVRPLANPPGT